MENAANNNKYNCRQSESEDSSENEHDTNILKLAEVVSEQYDEALKQLVDR